MIPLVLLACTVVLLFDTVISVVSKNTGIPYVRFGIFQIAMYLALGVVFWRLSGNSRDTLIPILIAAAVEASLGWTISARIGPGRTHIVGVGKILSTFVIVTMLNTSVGAVGMLLASIVLPR